MSIHGCLYSYVMLCHGVHSTKYICLLLFSTCRLYPGNQGGGLTVAGHKSYSYLIWTWLESCILAIHQYCCCKSQFKWTMFACEAPLRLSVDMWRVITVHSYLQQLPLWRPSRLCVRYGGLWPLHRCVKQRSEGDTDCTRALLPN